ncbi:MAG TPA: carboxypeptidase-like regulatory domain-containing protein [Vicinamibacterales bacterium]|jgi:hypothetical protein|nr:carboxypeptidase-like regulatory domain-containing protein [Vicinamibacterales bacterium]
MSARLCVAAACLLSIASLAAAPQDSTRDLPPMSATGSGAIGGVVTSDAQGAPPVRRALVTLSGNGASGRTMTDDAGRFVFDELPAGRYTVTVAKAAFVTTYYGSPRAGRGPGTPIPLADGQRVTTLAVTLTRGAVIEGTLRDGMGTPLSSGQVRVQQVAFVNGERTFINVPGILPWATTDDRGVYRIYGLPPGEYVVSATGGGAGVAHVVTSEELEEANRLARSRNAAASRPVVAPRPQPSFARVTTFHPDAAAPAQARAIALRAGEERAGVDIASQIARVSRIAGVVIGERGNPERAGLIGIVNLTTGSLYSSAGAVRADADGRFATPPMPAGRYQFFGRAAVPATPDGPLHDSWLSADVELGETDVSGVVLSFQPGATIAGRVALDGANTQSFTRDRARVSLASVDSIANDAMPPAPVSIGADGTFRFASVAPGRYRLALSGLGAWAAVTALRDGRNWLDEPIDLNAGEAVRDVVVALTDRATEITGTLFDQLGRPAPEYAVVVYPVDPALRAGAPRRSTGLVRLGTDGSYAITGLPAGEYFLAAVTELDPAQLNDPAFLDAMSAAAIRITLSDGERKRQDVRLGR